MRLEQVVQWWMILPHCQEIISLNPDDATAIRNWPWSQKYPAYPPDIFSSPVILHDQ